MHLLVTLHKTTFWRAKFLFCFFRSERMAGDPELWLKEEGLRWRAFLVWLGLNNETERLAREEGGFHDTTVHFMFLGIS